MNNIYCGSNKRIGNGERVKPDHVTSVPIMPSRFFKGVMPSPYFPSSVCLRYPPMSYPAKANIRTTRLEADENGPRLCRLEALDVT